MSKNRKAQSTNGNAQPAPAPAAQAAPTAKSDELVVTGETLAQIATGDAAPNADAATATAANSTKKRTKGENVKVSRKAIGEMVENLGAGKIDEVKASLAALIAPKAPKAGKGGKAPKGQVMVSEGELARLQAIEAAMIAAGYTAPKIPLAQTPRIEPANQTVSEIEQALA